MVMYCFYGRLHTYNAMHMYYFATCTASSYSYFTMHVAATAFRILLRTILIPSGRNTVYVGIAYDEYCHERSYILHW
jgi:hypothetical protein